MVQRFYLAGLRRGELPASGGNAHGGTNVGHGKNNVHEGEDPPSGYCRGASRCGYG
jgi:hypothetical protein